MHQVAVVTVDFKLAKQKRSAPTSDANFNACEMALPYSIRFVEKSVHVFVQLGIKSAVVILICAQFNAEIDLKQWKITFINFTFGIVTYVCRTYK